MKKFFSKIGLSLFAAILAINSLGLTAYAQGEGIDAAIAAEFYDALSDVEGCYDEYVPSPSAVTDLTYAQVEEQYKGIGYLITIIEEPLDTLEVSDGQPDGTFGEDPFIQMNCYRNVFAFTVKNTDNSRRQIRREIIGKSCSNNAQNLTTGAASATAGATYSCKKILVLFSKGGTSTIEGYIATIYRWGVSLGGLLAVMVIILNGIRIAAAGSDDTAVSNAKTRIIQSLAGLAVLIIAGLILYTINPTFYVF